MIATAAGNGFITPKEARRLFHSSPGDRAIRKWMNQGVRVRGAPARVCLQFVREGGRMLTTAAWIAEFNAACNVKPRDLR